MSKHNRNNKITIGTRSSKLALKQTNVFIEALVRSGVKSGNISVKGITTKGDEITECALSEIGGKGLFIEKIDDLLIQNEIDFAVHSLKDVPTQLNPKIVLRAFLPRAKVEDMLIIKRDLWEKSGINNIFSNLLLTGHQRNYENTIPEETTCTSIQIKLNEYEEKEAVHHDNLGDSLIKTLIEKLPNNHTLSLATCSPRRSSLLQHLAQPNKIKILPMRGNVDTRIDKLRSSKEIDGILLARCGIEHIDALNGKENDLVALSLPPQIYIPAAGQGIITVATRGKIDSSLANILNFINCEESQIQAIAERAVLAALDGDCHTPVGCYSSLQKVDGEIILQRKRYKTELNIDLLTKKTKYTYLLTISSFVSNWEQTEMVRTTMGPWLIDNLTEAEKRGKEVGEELKRMLFIKTKKIGSYIKNDAVK